MVAHRVERVPGRAEQLGATSAGPAAIAGVVAAATGGVRRSGGEPQRVGVPEPGVLVAQLGGPRPAAGRRASISLQAAAAAASASRARSAACGHARRPARARPSRSSRVQLARARPTQRPRVPREPVEHLAVPGGCEQPPLVGLAVHGDEVLGQLGEHADRGRPAADVGARAARRTDRAGQHQHVVVELRRRRPARRGRPAGRVDQHPALDDRLGRRRRAPAPESARPPSSRPSPVTTMVLPAPVSPVTHGQAGVQLEHGVVDDAEAADAHLLQHARTA